tara:strand:- start:7001 stop:7432 length:432 start_codon:yes stop_codon:yes gene_type:complete
MDTKNQKYKIEKNIFINGTSTDIANHLVSLIYKDKDEEKLCMWENIASRYLKSLVKPLVFLRDKGDVNLDANTIKEYFDLRKTDDLANRKDIPIRFRRDLYKYVLNLPGYIGGNREEQSIAAMEHHGYITMQFTEIFSEISYE